MLSSYKCCIIVRRMKHNWIKPKGHETGIMVYNCITRDKQPLIVRNKNLVTWYTCGPTVYDSAHIGHASCYMKLDIIQRILKQYFKLNLVTVMNITDIDDKIIAASQRQKVPAQELTKHFEKEFWFDMNSLGITKPNCVLRVTENMEIIKGFIQKLIDSNQAYKSADNSIYFDVKNYLNYGKLQNINQEGDNDVVSKKSRMDFALWKSVKKGEVYWESPWGQGRPGWHIECSALATYIFGSSIDIHAGGIDLRFPHHENEEAQSCVFHSTSQWVNYWLHPGHLHLKESEKMSKSLKNTIAIGQLLQDTSAEVFRLACVMSHYRSSMEFTAEHMTTAGNLLKNYTNFLDNCNNYLNGYIKASINDDVIVKLLTESCDKIHKALIDDFNTPIIVNVLNEIVSTGNSMLHGTSQLSSQHKLSAAFIALLNLFTHTLNMLGLSTINKKATNEQNDFIEVVNTLNDFRQDIRQIGISNKDKNILQLCDSVRDSMKKCGISIKDHGKISTWSLK